MNQPFSVMLEPSKSEKIETILFRLIHRYPDYIFYGDTAVAQSAQLNTRYGTESLKGVLLDIHFLSLTDYLVCTFSSQVRILVDHRMINA